MGDLTLIPVDGVRIKLNCCAFCWCQRVGEVVLEKTLCRQCEEQKKLWVFKNSEQLINYSKKLLDRYYVKRFLLHVIEVYINEFR